MIEGGSTESTSSEASGGTLKLDRRSRGIRDSVAESEHPSEKHEADSAQGKRGTGGGVGLSAGELQELQKNDPKRAKRILANRSSAARSKVRKLRYIAELESKSAALQEEASALHIELEKLRHEGQKLSEENGDLYTQALSIQEHMLSQRQETEELMHQVQQLCAMDGQSLQSKGLPLAQALQQPPPIQPSAVPTLQMGAAACSCTATGRAASQYTRQHNTGILAKQDAQEEPLLSLQFPRRPPTAVHNLPQLPPFANVASMFQKAGGWPTAATASDTGDMSTDSQSTLFQRQADSSLSSLGLSGSGGMSQNGQELGMAPKMDSALLELLSLNPRQEATGPRALIPPLRTFPRMPVEEGASNFGMLGPLPSLDSRSSAASSAYGLRSMSTVPLHPASLLELGRHRSVSSVASSYSNLMTTRPTAPPNTGFDLGLQDLPGPRQGLALWPRHFSDPQGFNRGTYFG